MTVPAAMPNDDELIDQPDVNSKTHTYGTDAFLPVNGVKSRRDTNQTANTFKIAKARSQNQISASGPGNSFNTKKTVKGNGNQATSGMYKMYGASQNVV